MSALEAPPRPAAAPTSVLAALSIDSLRRRASVRGAELYLSEREFALLAALASEPERTLTYEELIGEVFAGAPGVSRRVVDANAARLRRKLELRGMPGLIAPCQGVGFRFGENPDPAEGPGASVASGTAVGELEPAAAGGAR